MSVMLFYSILFSMHCTVTMVTDGLIPDDPQFPINL